MTLSGLLFTYLLGGLTFIPLLLAAILVPAWRLLPEVKDAEREGGRKERGVEATSNDENREIQPEEKEAGGASGTFAVLRRYDFQAATAALSARHNAGAGGTTTGADGMGEVANTGESVYQSVYRSVFDRNKNAASATSILENEDVSSNTTNARQRKRVTPVNIFFIVLRHGYLILYDSSAQVEVRHMISLAHHTISLSSGEGNDEADMKDGDLFIKRTAIVLTPKPSQLLPNGDSSLESSATKKPFFLFAPVCIEKEDFYHALLSTRSTPPIPRTLDTEGMIKLQSTLHSTSSLTPETRALNAIISRLFLALHHTDRLKTIVRNKIEKKISRVQKPAFIASLAVQSIELGDAAPVISNLRLRDLNIGGDMIIAFDLRYTGGIKMAFSALAKLDLGPRFKTRTADLLLSTCLSRLQGHVLVRIKPPPSNRLWFCFESIPEMDIKVEPIVQSKQITYTFILRAIEERIRSVVGDTLVKPNWDDFSFFDTTGQNARGGIWSVDAQDEDEESQIEMLKQSNDKTKSMPALVPGGGIDGDVSGTSSGSETAAKLASGSSVMRNAKDEIKRRSVVSLPADQDAQTPPQQPPRPARTPSFTSPSASTPSVHLDESPASSEPIHPNLEPQPEPQTGWRIRPAPRQQSVRKDAIQAMREMRDRSLRDTGADTEEGESSTFETVDGEGQESRHSSDPSLPDRSRGLPKRTQTNISTMTSSSTTSTRSQRQEEAAQKGKALLAATAAATNAAKTWSWNAIQNRTKNSRGNASQEPQGPVGRGQPLPPPGMPLPGPQKGWLPSGVGIGSVKRKPVPALPPRKPATVTQQDNEKTSSQVSIEPVEDSGLPSSETPHSAAHEDAEPTTVDEFGPWRENSGAGLEGLEADGQEHITEAHPSEARAHQSETDLLHAVSAPVVEPHSGTESDGAGSTAKKKVPPPLPPRSKPRFEQLEPLTTLDAHLEQPEQSNSVETSDQGHHEDQIPPEDHLDDIVTPKATNVREIPILGEDIMDEGSESEHDHRDDESDAESLVAIPAPVKEDVEEPELEHEGVEDISDHDAEMDEAEHAKQNHLISDVPEVGKLSADKLADEKDKSEHDIVV